MEQKKIRRRNYFIKKDFQGKYIFSYFVNVVVGSIIFALILSLFSANTITLIYEHQNLQVGLTPIVLLKKVLSAHWLFIVFGGALVVLGSMLLTHRVAGPLFRFEKTFDHMLAGHLGCRIYLRAKDEGKELAAKINAVNQKLSSRIGELQNLNGQLNRALRALEASGTDDPKLAEIQALQERMGGILDGFIIDDHAQCR